MQATFANKVEIRYLTVGLSLILPLLPVIHCAVLVGSAIGRVPAVSTSFLHLISLSLRIRVQRMRCGTFAAMHEKGGVNIRTLALQKNTHKARTGSSRAA